jgi:methionyl-tRNA formyltransferase
MLASAEGAAARAGVPFIVPSQRDVNHPDFLASVSTRHRPELALSLLVMQVFRRPLLDRFERVVNFHLGRVPAYRGLFTSGWEVYAGEPTAGFAFHLMTEGIDEGPVLVRGAVPVGDGETVEQLDWAKTEQGAGRLHDVLDLLVSGAAGEEQHGRSRYFGRAELRAIRRIEDPAGMTWGELERRLRAFQVLRMQLGGATYPVTSLRRLERRSPRRAPLSFTSRDGVRAEVSCVYYLPPTLSGLARWQRARASRHRPQG